LVTKTLIKNKGIPISDPNIQIFDNASGYLFYSLSARIPPPIELVRPPKNKIDAISTPYSDLYKG
jgi:hypothetical protein